MDRICRAHGKINVYKIMLRKTESKRLLGRHKYILENKKRDIFLKFQKGQGIS
jgi:hypothetical protein